MNELERLQLDCLTLFGSLWLRYAEMRRSLSASLRFSIFAASYFGLMIAV